MAPAQELLMLAAVSGFFGGAFHALLTMWSYDFVKGRWAAAICSGVVGAMAGFGFFAGVVQEAAIQTLFQYTAFFYLMALMGYVAADIIDSLYFIRLARGAELT